MTIHQFFAKIFGPVFETFIHPRRGSLTKVEDLLVYLLICLKFREGIMLNFQTRAVYAVKESD